MASSSNNPDEEYDVFLSFRGEDTRNNFTSHLDAALRHKKIQTFIDDELERGEEISSSLLEAIERSMISVVVLSENYASSRWCLEELAKILDCKKRFGQMVIPIFYHVDPSHVRNQTGAFGKAFNALKKRFEERLDVLQRFISGLCPLFYPKKENDLLQRWETALMEVGKISGITTDSKDESELIGKIVMDILKRLEKMSLSDYSDLIGVEFVIKEIESLLKIGSNDVCIVGIWGLGGIGKTSICHAIFNKYWSDFEDSFFAENVREESVNSTRLIALRRELLGEILGDRNANPALTFTKQRLARKKALIVFDDVTSSNQIENLIGDPKCLGLRSRIIITSRDKHVLDHFCEANRIYKLEGLSDHAALQLFSHHAFRHNGDTSEEYAKLSKWMVTYAKGVPLTLKVLGSFLLGKTKEEWESAMNKLKRCLHKDIQSVLKISFDGLDYEEKEIFLDIACFFKGSHRDLIIDVMDSCGYFAKYGLSVLIDKSLIIVSNNMITMHDLLEEMGREIVRQESIEDPNKCSRLFHYEDIYNVLTSNKETEAIKGICLDVSRVKKIHISPHAFSRMQNLKYLKVYDSHYGKGFNKLYGFQNVDFEFLKLKYLSWPRYAWKSLPPKFNPKNLVALEMPGSKIKQLWHGAQDIVNLKHIDLKKSRHLLRCPNLSRAKNLETLNLEDCTSLIEIHSSIQYLNKLSTLILTNCTSLCSIPSGIYSKSLQKAFFSGCSNLDTVPSLSCNVKSLCLDGTAIRELPSSIKNLSKLYFLDLSGCKRLKSLPSSICKLESLVYLTLMHCSRLENLPSSIFSLNALKHIDLFGCSSPKIVSSFPCNSESLHLDGSTIQELPLSIRGVTYLNLSYCCITELPSSLGQLTSLKYLHLGRNKFERIPASIINLSHLLLLNLCDCDMLKSLPELPSSITCIDAHNCKSLELLSGLSSTTWRLDRVDFINCLKLDQSALEDIAKPAPPNLSHRGPTVPMGIPHYSNHYLCFPGTSIPKWFTSTFRSEGSSIELALGYLNDDVVGFSFCIVLSLGDDHDPTKKLRVDCEVHVKSDGEQYEKRAETNRKVWGLWSSFDSDHLFLACADFWYSSTWFSTNSKVLFQFYIRDFNEHFGRCLECYEVKECGILFDVLPADLKMKHQLQRYYCQY
ncbi:disease resistance-like protein DSC1 [Mangifera indica]|uniref:disease resistance-like protein DSC1 n=1 Tax=Mangifera indica TaxID=29780 RepID=UPI001CFBC9D4|nr:disease resistance-like protein DSC1 [Mangifera indica]XP_044506094.1 disease resistance-like protein DSC1 [Mangifera indica]